MTKGERHTIIKTLAKIAIPYLFFIIILWLSIIEVERVLEAKLAYPLLKIIMGIIVALIFSMCSSIVRNIVHGMLIERFSIFLKGVALSFLLYYFLDIFPIGKFKSILLDQFLLFCLTISAYSALLPYVESRSPIVLKSILNAITATLITYYILNLIWSMNIGVLRIPTQPDSSFTIHLESIIMTGWIFLIISILVGLLRWSHIPPLKSFATVFPKGVESLLLGIFVAFYLTDLRPVLLTIFLTYLEVTEWTILGTIILYVYLRLRREIIPESKDLLTADWKKHVQEVSIVEDKDFEELTRVINAFVENSKKESLIVYLAYMLAQKSISREEAEKALSTIINYSPVQRKSIIFSWDLNYISVQERLERLKCLKETLSTIDVIMSSRSVEVKG